MKHLIITIACSLFLTGCGSQESQQNTSNLGFTMGSSRDAIVNELEAIEAKVLSDTPELLRAEFTSAKLKKPMQVELAFSDGKLEGVHYIPQ